MANKQMVFMIAGMSLSSAGVAMEMQDVDNVGADDKGGKALEILGKGCLQYASGNLANAKQLMLQAADALKEFGDAM